MHEGDEPDTLRDLPYADELAREGLTHIDFLTAVTHAPAMCDGGAPIVKRILQRRQAGVGTRRRGVDLSRHLHPEPFMRSLAVVSGGEGIKAILLLKRVGGRRLRGFALERQMHAFVAAVLLWMARCDALELNAKA